MRELFNFMGEAIGTVSGVAIAPLAIALDCTAETIETAIKAGCRTKEEIREWVIENEV